MNVKPKYQCNTCYHSGQTMCELNRVGWPYAGDWCRAFTPKQVSDRAIQTPESIPSQPLDSRSST